MIGPPRVAPYILLLVAGGLGNFVPKVLVPLFVIALTLAPVKPDCFTSNGERFTDISWNASSAIGFPPPGKRSDDKPKLLFRLAPSTVTLFILLSLPAKLVPLA